MTTDYVPAQWQANPTTTQLNSELIKIRAALDNTLKRANQLTSGAPFINQMEIDLDMNGQSILNAETDLNDPTSLVTVAALNDVTGVDVSALEATIAALQVALGQTNNSIDIVDVQTITNATAIQGNADDITALDTLTQSLLVGVAQINNKLDTIELDIIQNATDIAALIAKGEPKIDRAFSFNGLLPDNTVVAQTLMGQQCFLRASEPGNVRAATAATAATVIDILKNGVVVGSINFAAGAQVGVFNVPNDVTFSASNTLGLQTQTQNGLGGLFVTLIFDRETI